MKSWKDFSVNEYKPGGWLKRQLAIQAAGLSGNLDKVWPSVRDGIPIGSGKLKWYQWERVPYWLDGFIPLAFLLDDEDMKQRAKRYVDAIVQTAHPNGLLGPWPLEGEPNSADTWTFLLTTKVLALYHRCTEDPQVWNALYRSLKSYHSLLSSGAIHLSRWDKYRWFEGLVAIHYVYDRCAEPWLKELATTLREQGVDYAAFSEKWERPLNVWTWETHVVNLAMMLKAEIESCTLLDETYTDQAEQLYQILMTHNGTPVGAFTGDECLSGTSPIQGTELCGITELMYSMEELYRHTADPKWAERLELLAFNALPGSISEDMWSHQYVQMSNQIACQRFPGKSLFRTNGSEAHIFGLEPQFGCCTANFNQGWPKFALSSFLQQDDMVLNAIPVPGELHTNTLHVVLDTNYPFENRLEYRIESEQDISFMVRIPKFAENVTVNGNACAADMLNIPVSAGKPVSLTVTFETTPRFIKRPNDLYNIQCGSLVFVLPISNRKTMMEYERDGVERKYPYCDYELTPEGDWNYAFSNAELKLEYNKLCEVPFSETQIPLTVQANVQKIDWGYEDGYETVCAKLPKSRLPISQAQKMAFYPYACAKLRMTELPFVSGFDVDSCS